MAITEDRLRQTFSEGGAQEIYQEVKASGDFLGFARRYVFSEEPMEQREQSDACINSAESRQKKAEGQQIEQKKQLLAEKMKAMKALYNELAEAGAIEISEEDLENVAGGIPGLLPESIFGIFR